jgi:hypothetical protein
MEQAQPNVATMKTATILPAMKSPDDQLDPVARKGSRPEPSSGLWRRLFEPISSGPRQLLLAFSLRPGWLAHSWWALAIAALVGVGGMALALQLEAADAPTSTAAQSGTNRAPALSSGQSKAISWKESQTLLTEGSNLSAAQVRIIEADLKRDPADEAQWARLLGFYARQSSETNVLPFAKAYARIVEARPTSVLVDAAGMRLLSPLLMDEAGFELVALKWIEVAKRQETNVVVLSRAGMFLTGSPVCDKYAPQGEAMLEQTVLLEPRNPQRNLELAERNLEKAKPRFDDPDGDIAAARKALAYLQAGSQQLPQSERARPELQQKLTRAAFWAGEYTQARTYAQDWLKASAQLEQAPAPATQNQRHTRAADRGDAIHDANMILGEIALSEGKTKEGLVISAGTLPAIPRSFAKVGEATARVRVAQAALALERHRFKHGNALPTSLDALVPGFLEAVPIDPFDGKPLRYEKLEGGGYVVYSVGKDRQDDHGVSAPAGAKAAAPADIPFAVRR